MVRYDEITEAHLDVTTPCLPSPDTDSRQDPKKSVNTFFEGSKQSVVKAEPGFFQPPLTQLEELYRGTFVHPSLGHERSDLSMELKTAESGKWTCLGHTEEITVRRKGIYIIFSDGHMQLSGKLYAHGNIAGAVIIDGRHGGRFEIFPDGCGQADTATKRLTPAGAGVGQLEDSETDGEEVRKPLPLGTSQQAEIKELQARNRTLKVDNEALKGALCAHAGGSLPVDFLTDHRRANSGSTQSELAVSLGVPLSPKTSVTSSKRTSPQGSPMQRCLDDDELATASLPVEARVSQQRKLSDFQLESKSGLCDETANYAGVSGSLLGGCYGPCDTQKEVLVDAQVASRHAPQVDFLSPSTSMSQPSYATPAFPSGNGLNRPPPKEKPMDREALQGLRPSTVVQRPQLSWQKPLALSGRPRPDPIGTPLSVASNYGGLQWQSQLYAMEDDDDEAPPAPPEVDIEVPLRPASPPSPPPAPSHEVNWTPNAEVQKRPFFGYQTPSSTRSPVILPFPDTPLHII
eukprot:TRINITY_DN65861_c0_g1_i1.p1 TRINITY_DN65861_c0_g1~~TRINITY_DN65861_c0_g1_i1.p1  ORF type:complete len:517 (-),score=112.60 TRINITY_DN65861_c0_g1_i1:58-1608(-)